MSNMFDEYYNALGNERRRRMNEYSRPRPMWTSYTKSVYNGDGDDDMPGQNQMSRLPDDVTMGSLPDDVGPNAGGFTSVKFYDTRNRNNDRDYTPGAQTEDLHVRIMRLQEENEKLRAENERLSARNANDDKTTDTDATKPNDDDNASDELAKVNEEIKRLTADFYNYRNRTKDDHDKGVREGKSALLKAILPALDDIELIEMHNGLDERMSAVMGKLRSALSNMGATEYGEKEEPFDPNIHHAVLTVNRPDAPESGIIDTIVNHGWTLDGTEVRPATVVVAQPTEGSDDDGGDDR